MSRDTIVVTAGNLNVVGKCNSNPMQSEGIALKLLLLALLLWPGVLCASAEFDGISPADLAASDAFSGVTRSALWCSVCFSVSTADSALSCRVSIMLRSVLHSI